MSDFVTDAPIVELLAFCEESGLVEHGRPQLGGMFSRVGAARLPIVVEKRTIALEVWGQPYRTVALSLRIVGPSFPDGVSMPDFEVEIEPHGFVTFGALVDRLPLSAAGVHALEVVWEGQVLRRTRFLVVVLPQLRTGNSGDTRTASG